MNIEKRVQETNDYVENELGHPSNTLKAKLGFTNENILKDNVGSNILNSFKSSPWDKNPLE